MDYTIKKAVVSDVKELRQFTDFWLAGRGKRINTPGATNDCFVSPSQHKKYVLKYQTWIVIHETKIIAWAVIQHNGSLIHFLVAGDFRGRGIGTKFMDFLNPSTVRSKSNQESGNPGPFYEKLGYHKIESIKSRSRLDIDKTHPDREKIIDIYEKVY